MKLTFLGTSHGVPEAHRRCSCTMLTFGEGANQRTYFVDMGADASEDLVTRGIPLATTKAIFITHKHGDHTNGLIPFIDLANWFFKTSAFTVYLPKPGISDTINHWLKLVGTDVRDDIRYDLVKTGTFYDDGFLKVTAYPTLHCDDSYAFLIEAEGKRLLFTGDLKHRDPAADFPVSTGTDKPLDIAVCECAHFDASLYEPIFKQMKLGLVVYNHYQPRKIGGLYQMIAAMPELPQKVATDGLEIVL
ncbi:MAG: MBL fold metallo-hydrolase [Clostridia bacterium]|nr:MBL fold metallo-hydrolase [Clostridia bacterium]